MFMFSFLRAENIKSGSYDDNQEHSAYCALVHYLNFVFYFERCTS